MPLIGSPLSRVDGPAKVTGTAKYAAEHHPQGLLHAFPVASAIAVGAVARIDTSAAKSLPGVVEVFTHENRPKTAFLNRSWQDEVAPPGSPFRPLYDEKIFSSGQPVALVVAESLELARYAASLLKIDYAIAEHETDLLTHRLKAAPPHKQRPGIPGPVSRGDFATAYDASEIKLEAEYYCPTEHHNPMEMHASTVIPNPDGSLLIHDKTQGPQNCQTWVASVFNLKPENVRVLNPYVGGAFGSGLRPQYQLFLAVMAALELKRPIRCALTRQQMFTFGHRPDCIQTLKLGAAPDGLLKAISHDAITETSRFEEYTEQIVNWSAILYGPKDFQTSHKLLPLDHHTPEDMRAPGATWGVYAIECAMDELAVKLNLDPVELRLRNYTEVDATQKDAPYTSKALRACYQQGAKRFGWHKRNPKPRSMREGKHLIGYGFATGIWDAQFQKASARATLTFNPSPSPSPSPLPRHAPTAPNPTTHPSGVVEPRREAERFPSSDSTHHSSLRLEIATAASDIGTGTYTILTQIAAEHMGLSPAQVTVKLGDSSLPKSPLEGGSWMAASNGSAVKLACDTLRESLLKAAQKIPNSPLPGIPPEEITCRDAALAHRTNPNKRVPFADIFHHAQQDKFEEEVTSTPNLKTQQQYAAYAHSAVFVEVRIDESLGTIGVSRLVTAVAAGKILNPKTARSQLLGGALWGVSSALFEETYCDHALGRFMNHDFAQYHIPTAADTPDIDILFVEEHDDKINPLGIKGVGEIGITGVAAAIANAIHHATGKRIRSLPITLDKVLL